MVSGTASFLHVLASILLNYGHLWIWNIKKFCIESIWYILKATMDIKIQWSWSYSLEYKNVVAKHNDKMWRLVSCRTFMSSQIMFLNYGSMPSKVIICKTLTSKGEENPVYPKLKYDELYSVKVFFNFYLENSFANLIFGTFGHPVCQKCLSPKTIFLLGWLQRKLDQDQKFWSVLV